MLSMLFFLPSLKKCKTMEEKLDVPIIKFNPVYWVLWALTTVMLAGGRAFHAPFGQGAPVRPDETESEHEGRVQWIYANDCTYAVSLALDIWALAREIEIHLIHRHAMDGHHCAIGVILGTALLLFTIGGNLAFYNAMRNRSALGVRAAISANAGFAFVMSLALAGAARKKGLSMLKMSWGMRA